MKNWKRVLLFVGLPIMAVMAITCGVAGANSNEATPAEPQPVVTTQPTADNVFAFGESVSIGDGIVVTLTPVADYVPGEYSAGYSGATATCYHVVIQNQTAELISPLDVYITASAPGGQPLENIFDLENGVEFPTGELFPGESMEWRVAFDGEVGRVKVESFLDFGAEPAYFTSTG